VIAPGWLSKPSALDGVSHSITSAEGEVVGVDVVVGVVVVGVVVGVVVVVDVLVVVTDGVAAVAVLVTVDVVVVTVEVTGAVPTCATSMVVGARPNNKQTNSEDARVGASMAYQPLTACELIATRDARRAPLLHQGWARRES
jgi:hypothetical protein